MPHRQHSFRSPSIFFLALAALLLVQSCAPQAATIEATENGDSTPVVETTTPAVDPTSTQPPEETPDPAEKMLAPLDGLDFVLYDDFDSNSSLDELDPTRWQLTLEGDTDSLAEDQPVYHGIQDDTLVIEGGTNLDLALTAADQDLRAIQLDLLPQTQDRSAGGIFFQMPVVSAAGDEVQTLLSYYCNTNYIEGPDEVMWCVYTEGGDQALYQSFIIPIPEVGLQQLRMVYRDQLGVFQTYLNGTLVDEVEVLEHHQQAIEQSGFAPSILVHQSPGQRIAFDNVVIGQAGDAAASTGSEPGEPDALLAHSDLRLYDDFENPASDMRWDSQLWGGFIGDEQTGIYQNDGALLIAETPDAGYASGMLYQQHFANPAGRSPNAIKLTFQADPADRPLNRGINLNMFLADNNLTTGEETIGAKIGDGALQCRVWYLEDAIGMECAACFGFTGCQLYDLQPIFRQSANVNTSHSMALEHDQASAKFYVYFDDELMFTLDTPADFDEPFLFALQTVSGDDPQGKVRIEEVWLGQPAQHPELAQNPLYSGEPPAEGQDSVPLEGQN